MRFYTQQHRYTCGIDLHARSLYVCILDDTGQIRVHKNIKATPQALLKLIADYQDDLIIGVECMFSWYWIADFCADHGIEFVLGHALYMKAIHGGKAKNDKIDSEKIARLLKGGMFPYAYVYPRGMRAHRDLMRRQIKLTRERGELMSHIKNTLSQYNLPANTENLRYAKHREPLRTAFPDPSVQRSIDLDLARIEFYDEQLAKLQWYLKKTAKAVDPNTIIRLKSVHGIGDILSLVILYEIHDIERFPRVQDFVFLAGRFTLAFHQTAIGHEILYPRKTLDVVDFIEDDQRQYVANAVNRFQSNNRFRIDRFGGLLEIPL